LTGAIAKDGLGFTRDREHMQTLAKDFKDPADLCAFSNAKGVAVVVPDLVKSEPRIIQLGRRAPRDPHSPAGALHRLG
jgi:hypothetical protein